VGDRLRALTNVVELIVPFERGDVIAAVHREGEVLDETTEEAGMRMRARLDDSATARLAEFRV
jgi:GTP-binding protein HflX